MKRSPVLAAAAATVALATSVHAQTLFSWEDSLQGWAANAGFTVALSNTGVTDGASSLQLTAPASSMWWSAGFWAPLTTADMAALASAPAVTLDVTYAGSAGTWNADLNVGLMLNTSNLAWGQYGSNQTVTPNGVTQTVTWTFTEATKASLASAAWGQMGLFLTYGNGGTAPSVINVDNLQAIPEPSTYAAIGGLIALGVAVALRRRRRSA